MVKVVLMSGGMDSSILLFDMLQHLDEGDSLRAIFINYHQANMEREYEAASKLCAKWEVPLLTINAGPIFEHTQSTLLRSYHKKREHTVGNDYVPNRNTVLISIAASAIIEPATIYVAAHKTNAPYADCTATFYKLMDKLTYYSTGHVRVEAPYIKKSKASIAQRGWECGMTREEFNITVSCYEGNNCGKCPACIARSEALKFLPIK